MRVIRQRSLAGGPPMTSCRGDSQMHKAPFLLFPVVALKGGRATKWTFFVLQCQPFLSLFG